MTGAADIPPKKKALCFVIGPIGKDGTDERRHADLLLNAVIKHTLETEEFNYKVKRADEDADPGMIGDRVVSDIINAELVVADLTGLNANAFYELGIRHATEKPAIHVAKSNTPLPFDNIAHRTIFVDLTDWESIQAARERLAESARAISVQGFKVSNPITQANASFKMRQSEDPRERVLAEMSERLSALEGSMKDRVNIGNSTENEDIEVKMRVLGVRLMQLRSEAKKLKKSVDVTDIAKIIRDLKIPFPEKWHFRRLTNGAYSISSPEGTLTVGDNKFEWDDIPF